MKAERLLLNAEIQDTIRRQRKAGKRNKRPEQMLCDLLNKLPIDQRRLIAAMLQ